MAGKVYIIGVGPGDPKLITLKAAECIGRADVVVYDRLINKNVLRYAKKDAELVYAGKSTGRHSIAQESINSLLAQKAMEGKIVARVKGGDPFLFGRGGEEAEYIAENGIQFEVVPGVTSAIAVPAYAGIPVTHRDYCSSLHIITGHETPGREKNKIDFDLLAKTEGTLVFLMGIKNMKNISQNLIQKGKDKNTPAAVIENGATPDQRVITGTLENIASACEKNTVTSPAVLVIGNVVQLEKKLRWFLKDNVKKVLVTRPESQNTSLTQKIEALGWEALEVPVIVIQETDHTELDKALDRIQEFSWLAFTSANGVELFFKRVKNRKLDIRILCNVKICAIGAATASALNDYGLNTEYIPKEYTTESLLKGLKKLIKQGEKLLLARVDIQEDELIKGLDESGILYENVPVYKTLTNWAAKDELIETLRRNHIDFITFTSPSTVSSLAAIVGQENMKGFLRVPAVCIGPVTANAAEQAGFTVAGVADIHTVDGLVHEMVQIAEE